MRFFSRTLIILPALFLLVSCGAKAPGPEPEPPSAPSTLVIKGSDTLGAKLVPQLIEAFRAVHPSIYPESSAEGSSSGFAAILDGTAQIAMSSREAKPEEIEAARAKGIELVAIKVCYDGIGIIVHESNPLKSISLEEIKAIFTGAQSKWSHFGRADGLEVNTHLDISIYTRNTSSGTYSDFRHLAMGNQKYSASAQKMNGNEAIAREVASNTGGVGYVGVAYIEKEGVKCLPVRVGDALIFPSRETILSGEYPISRPCYFYTAGQPTGGAKEFIDFALSAEGQAIAEQVGFIALE